MNPQHPHGPDAKNLMLALVAATLIMVGWQYFYERPRIAAQRAAAAVQQTRHDQTPATGDHPHVDTADTVTDKSARIAIDSPALHGTLSLNGARFDDLTLAQYRETEAPGAPEVKLLSPAAGGEAYFAEIGVLPADPATKVPDAATQWQSRDSELTPTKPVTLTWKNGAGLSFERHIALDDHFMFTVTTSIKNTGSTPVTLYPYGLVSRNYADTAKHYYFMHEGPLGVMDRGIEDITYKKLREDGPQKFTGGHGWVGITDKYWLTALVPAAGTSFDAEFKHFKRGDHDAYQSDLRTEALTVPAGKSADFTMHFFAGAKVVKLLDAYREEYHIPLFDRAVDFGSLYFLTRPIFSLLQFLHTLVGNFGLAILLLTVCIKLALFPLTNKSMTAMARTKLLTPQMTEIRERYAGDKMKINQEIMALYKREKMNPVAGCLPMLLQIPIFFALYRVLFVTIEMRQAPFYGWIHDLSAPDPSNIFTAFGLIHWTPPHLLHLGVLPMLYCITMILQQRINPKPADPIQASMMTYMPFFMTFIFMSFPAGLVIYYTCNNLLTVLQQTIINRRLKKQGLR